MGMHSKSPKLRLLCEGCGAKRCSRIRAELMGMYLNSIRIQLRCELVFMLLFNRVQAELMGMYFKSIRIQLQCEHVFMMLFDNVRAELMGLYIKTIRIQMRSELVFISSSKKRKLNSWTCYFKSISNSIAMWTHGHVFQIQLGQLTLWTCLDEALHLRTWYKQKARERPRSIWDSEFAGVVNMFAKRFKYRIRQ